MNSSTAWQNAHEQFVQTFSANRSSTGAVTARVSERGKIEHAARHAIIFTSVHNREIIQTMKLYVYRI